MQVTVSMLIMVSAVSHYALNRKRGKYMTNVGNLIVPSKNLMEMVAALLNSGYWVKSEPVYDDKVLLFIRKDEK